MFYCDDCAEKNKYPESLFKSIGDCEICGERKVCNERPSSSLPKPKPKPQVLVCDTEISGLNPYKISLEKLLTFLSDVEVPCLTSNTDKIYFKEKFTMEDIAESYKRIEKANNIFSIKKTPENPYPVIDVPSTGKPVWGGGARVLAFVYSRYAGNFVLKGYYKEVQDYLKKNYTHYFVNYSLWWKGKHRDIWGFWKKDVDIFNVSVRERKKGKKIEVRPYSGSEPDEETLKAKTFKFKRLPKRWIPEFNKF